MDYIKYFITDNGNGIRCREKWLMVNNIDLFNQIRENRFKYRKSELIKQGFDKNKTESQIMNENGFLKIYDCGSKKYEYCK